MAKDLILARAVRSMGSVTAALLIFAIGAAPSGAQVKVSSELVSFTAATAYDGGVTVRGELRVPESGRDRASAVLILHSSGGINGTGAFYAEALNQAGIATLEIVMFGRGHAWQTTRNTMPHAYGSLLFLAGHPRIEPNRIGVIGFSYGGIMSLIMASEEVTQQYTGGKARFAAHLANYPACFAHFTILSGTNKFYGPGTYRRLTGAPVHILAGDKDDFDDPDSCTKLVAAFPEEGRRHLAATVYPGAHHSWDHQAGYRAYYDSRARKGQGGTVRLQWDPEIAAKSRRFAVEFFSTNLGAK